MSDQNGEGIEETLDHKKRNVTWDSCKPLLNRPTVFPFQSVLFGWCIPHYLIRKPVYIAHNQGARCSFVVERPLMVQWIVGSIPRGGTLK